LPLTNSRRQGKSELDTFQLQKSRSLIDACAVFLPYETGFQRSPAEFTFGGVRRLTARMFSNEGMFCGGILFDPKPQVMALAASLR